MDFRRPLRVVTPGLDADVLGVLARADAELTGRQIQRLAATGSPQGVRNAADRLTREGVVHRRTVGKAHLYSLNRDHVAASWIEGLASLPDQIVDRLTATISQWRQTPLLVVLFGSIATGAATAESDIDILVVRPAGVDSESDVWSRQLMDLEAQATAWTGNDARILEYGEDELERVAHDSVLQDALQDGIELHGSRRALRRALGRAEQLGAAT